MPFEHSVVMGILNITPDSFFSKSRMSVDEVVESAANMLGLGAGIIDIGAYSTRPGAMEVGESEECDRLLPVVEILNKQLPQAILSVDTYRSNVARLSVMAGADIINDIGGGDLDPAMFETVAKLKVPYVLMHMRGTPQTMQQLTDYNDLITDVITDLSKKLNRLRELGVADVIIDPGFGFAKTIEQNFMLMKHLEAFDDLGCPTLVGISRKGMIWKTLGIHADEALNGTTVLNTIAVQKGASILRVHDVKEAIEVVKLVQMISNS